MTATDSNYVIGIDPGARRTGVCLFNVDKLSIVGSWDVDGGAQGFIDFVPELPIKTVAAVIVEDYIPFKAAGDPRGLEIIGVVRYLRPDMILQSPQGRKAAIPDEVLKRLGWYLPGEQHRNEREAIRHIAWYLKQQKNLEFVKKAWPPK